MRPDRKILLLSGPPGFGKTTLAHVIGKQAGYNIVEVNAR
jgi:chromosome transmission fidelity protein 18